MLRRGEKRGRTGQLSGPSLSRMVPAHHPVHARTGFSRGHETQIQKGGPPPVDNPADLTARTARNNTAGNKPPTPRADRPRRRLIRLTIGEIRRLFNLTGKDDHAIDLGLYWS